MSKRKTRSSTTKDEETPLSPTDKNDPGSKNSETSNEPDLNSTDLTSHQSTHPFGDKKPILCQRYHPTLCPSLLHLIFTHGAGGGISAPATQDFAKGFGSISKITCFEGTLHLANRVKAFHEVVSNSQKDGNVVLGGRSMGARAAALTALEMETPPEVLVLVSWPLMAGSKGEKREPERREKILLDLPEGLDVLFMVGDLDAQCEIEMLNTLRVGMKARSWLVEVRGADHGMGMRKKKGDEVAMRFETGVVAAEWLRERDEGMRYCCLEWDQEGGKVVSSGWQEEPSQEASSEHKKRKTNDAG